MAVSQAQLLTNGLPRQVCTDKQLQDIRHFTTSLKFSPTLVDSLYASPNKSKNSSPPPLRDEGFAQLSLP